MTINWFNQRVDIDYSIPAKISNLFTRRAFIFALVIHLILALLLANLDSPSHKNQQKKDKIKAIQSYLYHPPAITQQVSLEKIATDKSLKKNRNQKKIKMIKSTKTNFKPNKNQSVIIKKTSSLAASKSPVPPQLSAAIRSKNSLSFSALGSLKQLQQQLDQQSISNEVNYLNRARGKSIFNDLPATVKHSEKILTLSEKREKMTTRYGGNIDIVKNNDGSCTLIQDLSHIGMTGIKASSSFKCGQTNMEKSYAAYMDKVLRKLGKKK